LSIAGERVWSGIGISPEELGKGYLLKINYFS